MNTDLVQSLKSAATKPATEASPAPQRIQTAPAPQETVAPAKEQTKPGEPHPARKVQETVAAVARQIDSYLRSVGRQVQLSIDSDSGETIITVRDSNTGELIRQIPSAEALRLSQSLADRPHLIDTVA